MYKKKIKVFCEGDFSQYLEKIKTDIKNEIETESEDYILNVNETEYINHLLRKFTIETPSIDFKGVYVNTEERKIPAEHFPFNFNVKRGSNYLRQVIIYNLPFTGDINLLMYRPSTYTMWTIELAVDDQCLCFEIINFNQKAEEIKRTAREIMNGLQRQLNYLINDIVCFNTNLQSYIEQNFKARKERILKNRDLLYSLDVPIKKRSDLPKTYSVPTSQIRKKITPRPVVTETDFKPEPALNYDTYKEILNTIFNVGKLFERLPSTYREKGEEDLRDHILLYLDPRFEGTATGETFNKTGKTDILLRYQNSNVFIAECKFWAGQKKYLSTITQLLGYLTWRDSKAAVIIFVKNKEFSSVIKTVEKVTPTHSNYLGFVYKTNETWFNYRFHINGDKNREVKLAVLLFHIPRH